MRNKRTHLDDLMKAGKRALFYFGMLLTSYVIAQPQWELVGLQDTSVNYLVQHPTQSNVLFASIGGFHNEALLKSSDYGESWEQVIASGSGYLPRQMSFYPTESDTIIASGIQTFWWSTDGGSNWEQRTTNLNLPQNAVVVAVYLPANPGAVFLSAQGDGAPSYLHLSQDGGATFEETTIHLGWSTSNLLTFDAHPNAIMILRYGPASIDGGESWQALDRDTIFSDFGDIASSTLPGSPFFALRQQLEGPFTLEPYFVRCNSIASGWDSLLHLQSIESVFSVSPIDSQMVMVTDSNANCLQISTDGGYSWIEDSDPVINRLWIRDIEFSCDGRYIYLATGSSEIPLRGIWRRENLTPVEQMHTIPRTFSFTVYPNPFNSITTLTLSLPGLSDVDVELYDVTGRYVKSITQERMAAGEHELRVDAAGLPSGIYFVKANAGEYAAVRKVVLVR
ncbi:T9SS C-terminal target domain-containing protein [bacterium]|nr:MAG: T9SS C-terminal target domain-containing protein [bacterium]